MNIPNNPETGKPFADLQAYVKYLENQTATLEKQLADKNNKAISFRVGEEKGAIGIYGLSSQGFPISLYLEQVDRFFTATTGKPLDPASPLGQFIAKADKFLSRKSETEEQSKARHVARIAETQGIVAHPTAKGKAMKNNNKQTV